MSAGIGQRPILRDVGVPHLIRLEHQEVADIAFGPIPLDDAREEVKIAINNALNMLTGYPHRCGEEVWRQFIHAPPGEVSRIRKKWKGTSTQSLFGRDVFDEMMEASAAFI